ncbi:oxidoreductase [Mycolicibacterium chubuense]|uniref:Cyclic-di-GMP-binding biofilm dispersal mediator protein n=1 Tax=Mycolicibacterium chubuense TaxID=1800 RepID=A0A0J6WMQ8_MYCCU|nr:3-oxoacyl-ACP reductase family protein [Mycolicibacterium chubuense]KMO84655.1 Cyclic-di-GMP-binding biofilm dispersal mediator protein [Mycolicibacterium chubuense]ORA47607.1 oxidoreductase [Mycolicibacterium chubuense]SPY00319.1 short-chain dehydrogenase/reductase SDR [Mycolicibacterium chubuense]
MSTATDSAPDTTGRPLNGRRALVTGGARGIGAQIVRRLAADGAAVAFTYQSSAEAADKLATEAAASGPTVVALQADSRDADAIAAAVAETVERLGGLDILVNNAGVASGAVIEDFTLEEFDRLVAVNVRGVFAATKAAVPHLATTDGGRIINIGSVNADRVPTPGFSVYAMTKAAVAGLTRGLARELGPRGVTVNNVQPGPIATDMNPDEGDFADQLRPMLATGSYGQPADVANAVAFLARRDTGYITGSTLNVDGGFTL